MLESGQIFAGRYRINRQIAEGGMGAIFEAEHAATERKVALKLLFPHIMSVASARQKFELEAKISARVNSPFIVEVLDAGFDEATKSPYLVMELLEGQTIASHVEQRGPLRPEEALSLLEQIADGLDAAHGYKESNGTAKPIVHRDLKPENLFMAREHGAVVVKILDFGIAKVLGETSNASQEVRGTPLYMAVEQLMAGVLSPQTDVWALGLIAYYLLTATAYWRSANLENAGMQSLFAEILSLPIEAPSLRVRQYNTSITLPAGFDSWLLKCLDREPSKRFASAGLAIEQLAYAFGRKPRTRTRPSQRTEPMVALAATEAFAPPTGPRLMPTKAATVGSLPSMVSESASLLQAPTPSHRTPWIAAATAGGLVLLASVSWLAFGRRAEEPNLAAGAQEHSAAAAAPVSTPAPTPSAPTSVGIASVATALAAAAPGSLAVAAVAPPAVAPGVVAAPTPPRSDTTSAASLQQPADAPSSAPSARASVTKPDHGAAKSLSPTSATSTPAVAARASARRTETASLGTAPRKPSSSSKKSNSIDAYRMR